MPIGMSIHIGINELSPDFKVLTEQFQLRNCIKDAESMADIARKAGYERIVSLHNKEATFKNLYRELGAVAKKLRRKDILLLSFAGHGAQVPNSPGHILDRKDEAWVLYDRPLINFELMGMLSWFRRKVRIIIVEDCCRKGDLFFIKNPEMRERAINDKRYRPRLLPLGIIETIFGLLEDRAPDSDLVIPKVRNFSELSSSVIILHACSENQLAFDRYGENPHQGFFTSRLLEVWNNGQFQGNYFDFHHNIIKGMPPNQSPDLETIGYYNPRFLNMRPFAVE